MNRRDVRGPLEVNVDAPMSAFVYTISTLHCMTVWLAHKPMPWKYAA